MNLIAEEMLPHLAKIKELPQLTFDLMVLVDKIPYYCGTPDCNSYGCLLIREAREKMREIWNSPPGIPNPNYKSK
jgi:hypothetical protein